MAITHHGYELLDSLNQLDGWLDSVKTMQANGSARARGFQGPD